MKKRYWIVPCVLVLLLGMCVSGLVLYELYLPLSPKSRERRCSNNLQQIDGAKDTFMLEHGVTNGTVVTWAELQKYIPPLGTPECKCLSGGEYLINSLGSAPTCSVHGDVLSQAFQE